MSQNIGIYTATLSLPLENKADSFSENRDSFISRHFASRFTYLMNIPVGIVSRVIDIVLSVFFMAASLATLSRDEKGYQLADDYLNSFSLLMPKLFCNVIKIINPQAIFKEEPLATFSERMLTPIMKKADILKKEDNLFKRHVISRTLYAIAIPLAAITRVIDFAIGLIIATAAVLLLGSKPFLNDTAFNFLGITQIVQDVFRGVTLMSNPWALN